VSARGVLARLAVFLVAAVAAVELGPLRGEREAGAAELRVTGAPEVVFDFSRDACDGMDIPDLPVRALRDHTGRVRLTISHMSTRWMEGPHFGALTHPCDVAFASTASGDPAAFDDREWLASLFTRDGRHVTALVHNEFQGHRHPGACPSGEYRQCWYNAITIARSSDGGRTFGQPPPPHHLVAPPHAPYVPDGGLAGYFAPSNVVFRRPFFYVLVKARAFAGQEWGTCLLRTRRPEDPGSWRAWSGRRFDRRLRSPYAEGGPRRGCAPVARDDIEQMAESLTYNTELRRFLLVGRGRSPDPRTGRIRRGFHYSLSRDLLRWTPRRLLLEATFPEFHECGGPDPVLYPSIVDHASRSRTYATSGRRMHLYFTRFNYDGCRQTMDRDLLRVPVALTR
jgi:hypothetical protein